MTGERLDIILMSFQACEDILNQSSPIQLETVDFLQYGTIPYYPWKPLPFTSLVDLTNQLFTSSVSHFIRLFATRFFWNPYLPPFWQIACPLLFNWITFSLSPSSVHLTLTHEFVSNLHFTFSASLSELGSVFASPPKPESISVSQHELIASLNLCLNLSFSVVTA